MKQLVVLVGCCVFLLAVAGCGRQNEKISSQPQLESETREDAFPEVMVGVWEAEVPGGHEWGFKFECDGSISKIVHFFAGEVDLREGGTYLEGPDPGTYAAFVMGPCETEYSEDTRELKVKIILDYYQMIFPQGELEGKSHDYFKGPVSEDGRTWKAEWRSYTWLEDATPPDIDYIDAHPEALVFTKIDLPQIRQEDGVQ